jgi:hypothetical protein
LDVWTSHCARNGFGKLRSAIAAHSVNRSGGWWVGVTPLESFLGHTYPREAGPVVNTSPLMWTGGRTPFCNNQNLNRPPNRNLRSGLAPCVSGLPESWARPLLQFRSGLRQFRSLGGHPRPRDSLRSNRKVSLRTWVGDLVGRPLRQAHEAVRRKRSRVPKPATGQTNPEPNIE